MQQVWFITGPVNAHLHVGQHLGRQHQRGSVRGLTALGDRPDPGSWSA